MQIDFKIKKNKKKKSLKHQATKLRNLRQLRGPRFFPRVGEDDI